MENKSTVKQKRKEKKKDANCSKQRKTRQDFWTIEMCVK